MTFKRLTLFALPLLALLCMHASTARASTTIKPFVTWNDVNGKRINAHGGGMFYERGFYYWYGEHKLDRPESQGFTSGGIHCYRSRDLINWNDLGLVLSVDYNNANSDITYGCRLERPKVLFNPTTNKYVALFKLYLKGAGVSVAYVGTATSNSAAGPFTYTGKFLAASTAGTGDFTFFRDPVSNNVYHFAVRKTDRLLVKAKLSPDYLSAAEAYTTCGNVATSTEGIAMIYRNGTYHLFGSGSAGWDPTASRYYTTSNLTGNWTNRGSVLTGTNPHNGLGPSLTYGGQSTFITQIEGVDDQYIMMMDVWVPTDPTTGTYIWLPFRIGSDNRISLAWISAWNRSFFQ